MNKLTKFSRAILAITIMLCVALPTLAHDFEVGGIYYNYIDQTAKTVKVTYKGNFCDSYNEYSGSVTIPSSVTYSGTTYSVTSIGSSAFSECTSLTSVTIPNSVTSIGSSAFSECTSLTSVTIPNSVTSIENYAFSDCTGLTEVNISDLSAWCKIYFENSDANPLYYAKKFKLNGAEIKDLVIPNDVTEIKNYAFYGCKGLTSITIPNSVTSIGSSAFYGTGWYNNQPDGILYLDNCCLGYKGDEPTGSLSLKEGTRLIGESAFSYCSGLTSITIPNSVTSIENYAFVYCTGLTSVTIPNSVTSIGSSAFSGCDGLTSITIPNSVTSIGDYAFCSCSGLTSITIPNSVTSIGSSAFSVCYGLTEVNISDLSAWCKIDFSDSYSNPLRYANKLKLNGAEIKDLVIPNDITKLKDYAFSDCDGLTSVSIGNSVTSIGNSAFYYCTGLTSVTIPNSVTSIGDMAFHNCTGLTEVNISDLSAWCKIDFSDCYANPLIYAKKFKLNGSEIKDLVIPNDITEIKNYTFSYCSSLTSVTIGNSVTEIGDEAFYYCRGLTSVTIGNSVTSIGNEAFNYCWDLDTIISLNPTPPVCSSSSSFDDYYGTLYVPKDSYAKYFVDEVWGQFNNIKKIEILASSITLNNSTIELDKGNAATITATITPSNATIKNIVWTSSNPQIATVDQSGKVTALTPGIATITAMANDGSNVSAYCKVVVKGVETKITLSQTEANLPVNDIITLSYEVIPLTTPVEWSTSNENVAYIKKNADNSVMVVGMADGVAIITAKALDGSGVSASCVVTVGVGGVEGVEMDNNAVEVARYDIHGRLLSEPTKGLNIIKMSDGTTRKEIVK